MLHDRKWARHRNQRKTGVCKGDEIFLKKISLERVCSNTVLCTKCADTFTAGNLHE